MHSLHEMFPNLAVSGHNNYVKSHVLYLGGKLVRLQDTYPDVFEKFTRGLFILRCSDNSRIEFSSIYTSSKFSWATLNP